MKKVIVYTTIGTVLIVLGVYFSPSKASASDITTNDVAILNINAAEKLLDVISAETREDKDMVRVSSILKAIEEGKVTQRQAEILDYLEEITPLEKNENVYKQLTQLYDVSADEFLSLKPVMEEIGLDINLYF